MLPLPADTLLGCGHPGDGVIDFGPISAAVAVAGYGGYVEVEIFNAGVWPRRRTGRRPPCGSGSVAGCERLGRAFVPPEPAHTVLDVIDAWTDRYEVRS